MTDEEKTVLKDEVIKLTTETIKRVSKNKSGFFSQLLDQDNDRVSMTNFFVVTVTLIGLLLLFIPVVILLVEVFYNHTITTDLSGMASYIAAVAAMFGAVGITKAWTNYSNNKVKSDSIKESFKNRCCDCTCEPNNIEYEIIEE